MKVFTDSYVKHDRFRDNREEMMSLSSKENKESHKMHDSVL